MTEQYNFFAFTPERMKDFFGPQAMQNFLNPARFDSVMAVQQKNVDALIEANRVAIAGYQELNQRLVSLFEESLAKAKDRANELQGQQINADTATQNVEIMRTAFEKAVADVQELGEMAQKANMGAFDVIKARVEEAMEEFRTAAEKAA